MYKYYRHQVSCLQHQTKNRTSN